MDPSMMKKTILISLLLTACSTEHGSGLPDAGSGSNPDLSMGVVVAGDFNVTGVLSTVRVPTGVVTPGAVAGVAGGDPFIRRWGTEVFVINRDSGDNVTVLDYATLQLVGQFSTGANSNPQDVVPIDNKLYVAALGAHGIVTIDRDNPTAPPGLIDLSSLDPADGDPDCVSVAYVDGKLFAACGILDQNFKPRGPGKIAVILPGGGPGGGQLVSSFDLPFANPVGYLVGGGTPDYDLLIATAPSFQDFSTGCLARVSTGATPAADGCLVSNHDLGGIANHYEHANLSNDLWIDVTAYDASFNLSGKVVSMDLGTKAISPITPPSGIVAVDMASCPNGYALVVDGTTGKAGVRIFKPDGTETTNGTVDIGMAPDFGNNTICY
jgi:hypothetical protein